MRVWGNILGKAGGKLSMVENMNWLSRRIRNKGRKRVAIAHSGSRRANRKNKRMGWATP